MLSVKGVLQQSNDVVANSVLSVEAFGPSEKFTGIDGGLLNGKAYVSLERFLFYLNVNPKCIGSLVFLMSEPMSVRNASTESAI